MKVTQAVIGKLPEGTHTVAPGLYLRVRGKYRNFFVRLQVNGKRREVGLGSAATMTVAAAKARAEMMRGEAAAKHEDWGRKEEKRTPLFGEFAQAALERLIETRKWKNKQTEQMHRQILKTYLLPILKDIPIDAITRENVLEVLNPIWHTKNIVAVRCRVILEKLLDLAALETNSERRNPAAWRGNLDFFLPPPEKVHQTKHWAAMTFEEAQKVVCTFFSTPYISHKAIVFGILTAARKNEFLQAKWQEIDFENAVWSVPPERRKDQKPYPHRVPLSKQAVALLKRIHRESDFVFTSPTNRNRCLGRDNANYMLPNFLKRNVTMHGCRSTFSDWGAREGIDSVLIEKSLMHATGNKVAQAYQRDDLLERRRPVMQAWADALFKGSGLAFD